MNNLKVLLLAFNRSELTIKLLDQLSVSGCDIYLSIDGARQNDVNDAIAIKKINDYAKRLRDRGRQIIIQSQHKNLGCRKAVIAGIDWFFSNTDQGVILEDDCHLVSGALDYFAESLEYYRSDSSIGMIAGSLITEHHVTEPFGCYAYNIWGWATWADRWNLNRSASYLRKYKKNLRSNYPRYYQNINFSLNVAEISDTWDVQWCISLLINNKKCIYPTKNLINNVGIFSSRTNKKTNTDNIRSCVIPKINSAQEYEEFVYAFHKPSLFKRILASTRLFRITRYIFRKFIK
jgi:hypothetical protein